MTRPTLEVREGQSATYYIRLSHDPIYYRHDENNMKVLVPCPEAGTDEERYHCGWWVRYRLNGVLIDDGEWDIDGDGLADIRVTPSIGRNMRRGDYRQWKSFSIEALEDGDSGDETVTFTHEVWGDDAECPVHNRAPVTIRIIDDEGTTPLPSSLTISDTTVTEGGTAEFVVTLTPANTQTVRVNYTTVMGSAEPGDYTGQSGSLTFAPNTTRLTIEVPTTNDSVFEPTENFTVKLSNPSGATISDDVGIGTITDNDPQPTLSITDETVEEGQTAIFTVTLSGQSAQAATVRYGTGDVTATAGSDYTARSGTLTFAVGDTVKTITVPTDNDTDVEADESFTVTLSNPTNARLDDATGLGRITDNDTTDTMLPTLSIADAAEVTEGDAATFTVTLNPSSINDHRTP